MIGVRRDSRSMKKDDGGQSPRRWRISAAIFAGTLLIGCVFAFFSPHRSFFHRSDSEVLASSCESSERILNMLNSDFAAASEENAKLEKEIKNLTKLLRLTENEKANALKQVLASRKQKKVEGQRTNPTVVSDESINPRLAKTLEKISVNRELILTLATNKVKPQLRVWFTEIKRLNIPNYLVYALDVETIEFCQSNNVSFYKPDADSSIDSIYSLKFQVLRELLQMGYSILLSDVDIVFLQNPFQHLYRDSDIESMSDGHDNMTAYGYDAIFDDVPMGWGRYAHTMRIWVYNSGFFYIRPTIPSIELLDRVAEVLAREKVWDQQVFNDLLFYPSYPGYEGLHASRRTMDHYLFMNSKVLFKAVRKDLWLRKMRPVMVHMNYHPDKFRRMMAVVDYYVKGEEDAFDNFPDGSRWR